jgi:hypothetical protein
MSLRRIARTPAVVWADLPAIYNFATISRDATGNRTQEDP